MYLIIINITHHKNHNRPTSKIQTITSNRKVLRVVLQGARWRSSHYCAVFRHLIKGIRRSCSKWLWLTTSSRTSCQLRQTEREVYTHQGLQSPTRASLYSHVLKTHHWTYTFLDTECFDDINVRLLARQLAGSQVSSHIEKERDIQGASYWRATTPSAKMALKRIQKVSVV